MPKMRSSRVMTSRTLHRPILLALANSLSRMAMMGNMQIIWETSRDRHLSQKVPRW